MIEQEEELRKNHLITTVDTLEKQFNVSFEVKQTSIQTGQKNVIHFTTGANKDNLGSRIPAVWLYLGKFHIFSDVNGNTNYGYAYGVTFPTGDWISVQISQIKNLSNYIYSITINGNVVHTVTNNNPAEFRNVQIFASDRWYEAQAGFIRNFVLDSKLIIFYFFNTTLINKVSVMFSFISYKC